MADPIPDDIQATARRLTGMSVYRTVADRQEHTDAIASAIMAERERCANIAEADYRSDVAKEPDHA